VHLRVIAVLDKNPVTVSSQNPRQKIAVAGVQEDWTVVIVEQWVDVKMYDECVRLQSLKHDELSTNDMIALKNNISYVSAPKTAGIDVLLSIQIGSLPAQTGHKDRPPAIVQAVNEYDDAFFKGAICKIKLPMLAQSVVLPIQLTVKNVDLYKARFNGEDPTTWSPNDRAEVLALDVTLTEENFFD
jgi:hypothetical protein